MAEMIKDSLYYAKILLFGEYGIIEDSMGLSIPYHFFKGSFDFAATPNEVQRNSNESIRAFVGHLHLLETQGELPCEFDFARLQRDLDAGLYFDSSIPQGFGVGSSGALVAAIYNQYAFAPIAQADIMQGDRLSELKATLAKLESFFHGKSSGVDPLICYLNLPILIKGQGDLGTVGIPTENAEGKGAIFLMNSGSPGKTQNMVSIFLNRLKDDGFRNMVKTQLKKQNDDCVKSFLKGDVTQLFGHLKGLSQLLLDNFRPMIPDHFEQVWRQGIESGAYYLKLCGSGGGGFILGFTQDFEKAESLLKEHKLQVIYKM
ncbi:MAG: mevalonate kinase [Bacteroidota bacterium]